MNSASRGSVWVCVFVMVLVAALLFVEECEAGWPLAPKGEAHPVRAGLIDGRGVGCFEAALARRVEDRPCIWHRGVDILVDETLCSPNAPAGACKVVYAAAAGKVRYRWLGRSSGSDCGRVDVGRFVYSHVNTWRQVGAYVEEGEAIGWSCRGAWHIHFAEKPNVYVTAGDRLNPLREGGVLASFNDGDATPPRLLDHRYEAGELWARIEDPVPQRRWPGVSARVADAYTSRLAPFRVEVNGRTVVDTTRVPRASFWEVMAPPTYRNWRVATCAQHPAVVDCQGQFWFRLGAHVPGSAVVRAFDAAENVLEVTL